MNLSNDGPYKIKSDLQKYDLDEDEINREIDNISEEDILEKLLKIINKKTKALKGSAYGIKQKIYFDMHNLGYSREMVDKVYNNNEDDSTSLERDYEKVYNSLLKKEKDDNKLYLKIKQKLYQKGYSLSKIDEVLEKKRDN
jgi:regulatory protein